MPPGMSLVVSEKHVDTNGDGVPDPVSDATPDDFTVPGPRISLMARRWTFHSKAFLIARATRLALRIL